MVLKVLTGSRRTGSHLSCVFISGSPYKNSSGSILILLEHSLSEGLLVALLESPRVEQEVEPSAQLPVWPQTVVRLGLYFEFYKVR